MSKARRLPKNGLNKKEVAGYGLLSAAVFTALMLSPALWRGESTNAETPAHSAESPPPSPTEAPDEEPGPYPTVTITPANAAPGDPGIVVHPHPLDEEQEKTLKAAAEHVGLTPEETKHLLETVPESKKIKKPKNTKITPGPSPAATASPSSKPEKGKGKDEGNTLGDVVDMLGGDRVHLPRHLNPFRSFMSAAAMPGTEPAYAVTELPSGGMHTMTLPAEPESPPLLLVTVTATIAPDLSVSASVITPADEERADEEPTKVSVVTVDTSEPIPEISKPVRASADEADEVSSTCAEAVTKAVERVDPEAELPPVPDEPEEPQESPESPPEGTTEPPQPVTPTD